MRKTMKFIKELREGERISQVYLCKTKTTATTKNGKNYYSLALQDKSGVVDAKVWDLGAGIDHFEAMDFIQIDAEVTIFAGAFQLNVKRIRKAREGEYTPSDYFPTTAKNIEEMYQELVGYINEIKGAKMKQLVSSFFIDDKEFVKEFKMHSAGKSVHHGYIGGLLEHTLSVTRLCKYYCKQYPMLNEDLLIAAAIFHDIGKMEELSDFPENDYTDDGQLLGHIMIGCEMIGARIRAIPEFPKKLASELKHCILSHHGELEYGSPKKPAIIEALALSFADNTDAKMQIMIEAFGANESNDWLGYHRFMESNIRRSSKGE